MAYQKGRTLHETLVVINNLKNDNDTLSNIYSFLLLEDKTTEKLFWEYWKILQDLHKNNIPFKSSVTCLNHTSTSWNDFSKWFNKNFYEEIFYKNPEAINLLQKCYVQHMLEDKTNKNALYDEVVRLIIQKQNNDFLLSFIYDYASDFEPLPKYQTSLGSPPQYIAGSQRSRSKVTQRRRLKATQRRRSKATQRHRPKVTQRRRSKVTQRHRSQVIQQRRSKVIQRRRSQKVCL